MKAFLKTLFGDPWTIAVVAVAVGAEIVLVACGQPALAAFVVPVLVLVGTAWLATN
jgi:hypothetical protein